MIVYVESNFVLELAFLQEHHQACDNVLQLAERRQIELAFPAFCIGEPYEALGRRRQRRHDAHEQVQREAREMVRSANFQHLNNPVAEFTKALLASSEAEKIQLDASLQRLLNAARVIPLDATVANAAIAFQAEFQLKAQDALVFSSVIGDLGDDKAPESLFLNRNGRDFAQPDVREALESRNCKLLTRFDQGAEFLAARLKSAGT